MYNTSEILNTFNTIGVREIIFLRSIIDNLKNVSEDRSLYHTDISIGNIIEMMEPRIAMAEYLRDASKNCTRPETVTYSRDIFAIIKSSLDVLGMYITVIGVKTKEYITLKENAALKKDAEDIEDDEEDDTSSDTAGLEITYELAIGFHNYDDSLQVLVAHLNNLLEAIHPELKLNSDSDSKTENKSDTENDPDADAELLNDLSDIIVEEKN